MAKQWLVLCGLALAFLGCRNDSSSPSSAGGSQGSAVVLTDANFEGEVLASQKPVLVAFYAPDDEACKAVGGMLGKLAAEFKDKAVVGLMDVKQNPTRSDRYVGTLPTIALFKQGTLIERLQGEAKEDQLRALLTATVGN